MQDFRPIGSNTKVKRESWYSRESAECVPKSSSSENSLEQMKPPSNYQTQNTLMKGDNSRLQEKPPQGNSAQEVRRRHHELPKRQTNKHEDLDSAVAQIEELQEQLEATYRKYQVTQRELSMANTELVASQRSNAEVVAKLEERIERLTRQLGSVQHKGIKETAAEIREIEKAETEALHESVRELRNEVGWLKYLSTTLQETCNSLKQELADRQDTEAELSQARAEINRLQKELTMCRKIRTNQKADSGLDDSSCEFVLQDDQNRYRRRVRKLKVENRRLYRLVEQLRLQLSRADSTYHSDYYFVTGF
ncbi:hypothetical protein T265_10855 [Opisthorchis viverrini]|uniref:Uncharacterized protein n=1 Tax=Opisthorchis viverrini TaxID=6198 RepID=A0A074Z555_OPIVI|nr:hypothetical protein T265_10855 [Opisthorchis viverrini]KER20647.1 hypothetical protein T265_10855 [Opisthorchis viverrini]